MDVIFNLTCWIQGQYELCSALAASTSTLYDIVGVGVTIIKLRNGKWRGLCLFTVINLEYDPFSVAWELATAYTQFYNEQPPSVMSRLEMRYLIPISHLQKSNRKLKMFHRGQVETNNDKWYTIASRENSNIICDITFNWIDKFKKNAVEIIISQSNCHFSPWLQDLAVYI